MRCRISPELLGSFVNSFTAWYLVQTCDRRLEIVTEVVEGYWSCLFNSSFAWGVFSPCSSTVEVSYFPDLDAMSNYNGGVDSAASDGNT